MLKIEILVESSWNEVQAYLACAASHCSAVDYGTHGSHHPMMTSVVVSSFLEVAGASGTVSHR